ncbi:hypothetical protein [Ktedonobacter racemifer]|uniref:hypothetical protein n=1 Tax=Ktedonobacter racemifer TaxID=363277 RepID=UPI00058DBFB3|nr:hypothetical protein [Ktedonobacter racemifer]
MPNWEQLREAERATKERALRHLDTYFLQLEESVQREGGHVHWACDGQEAVETVDAPCKRGEATLTIEALQKYALPADLRARMEREARTGEFKVEQARTQSEQDLKMLLGNPTPVPGATHHLPSSFTAPESMKQTSKSTDTKTR